MPGRPRSRTTSVAQLATVSVMEATTITSRSRVVRALPVSLFDTATPLEPLRERLHAAAAQVLDSGRYILGPEVAAFERELADRLGVRHVVGVANGTDALSSRSWRMGVGPGDDVVVPSFTFYASVEAIRRPRRAAGVLRRRPRHRVRDAADRVGRADRGHEGGGDRRPVRQRRPQRGDRGARRARARGRGPGDRRQPQRPRRGRASARRRRSRSSRPRTSAAFGDAGAVATDDDAVAERVRMLRFHGSRDKSDLRARRTQLAPGRAAGGAPARAAARARRLGRRRGARWRREYAEAGLGELVALPAPVAGAEPAWHLYVVRSAQAEALEAALNAAGIGARRYYRCRSTVSRRWPGWRPGSSCP